MFLSFVAPSYHRVGRGICEACGTPFSLLNPACSPCARCNTILCRKCFTRSCVVSIPCLPDVRFPLPFVLRSRGICDGCGPEADREEKFINDHLPFLSAGGLVTRIQPSLLGEASSQVLLSVSASEGALKFRSMQLSQNQQPKDSGEVILDNIAKFESGQAAAAGAGLRLALSGAAAALGGTSSSDSASYNPALVIHLVNGKGRTQLVFACTDERSFERWKTALTDAIAVSKSKYCSVFPPAGQRAAVVALEKEKLREAAAKEAAVNNRQAERAAFKESLGTVGMSHSAAILGGRSGSGSSSSSSMSSTAPPPGKNPAVLSGDQLERLGRPPGWTPPPPPPPPSSSLSSLSSTQPQSSSSSSSSFSLPPSVREALPPEAQAALHRAGSAASSGFSALRSGVSNLMRAIDESVPSSGGNRRGR